MSKIEITLLTRQAVLDAQAILRENDEDYSDEDVALAIRDWVSAHAQDLIDNIERHAFDDESVFADMGKFLRHRCDMPNCDATALEGDIFCRKHRAQEDAIIYPTAPDDDLLF